MNPGRLQGTDLAGAVSSILPRCHGSCSVWASQRTNIARSLWETASAARSTILRDSRLVRCDNVPMRPLPGNPIRLWTRRSQWLGYAWVSTGFALALWALVELPPPGVSIGILAAVGIFVTFRDLVKVEKAAWMVIITILVVVEIESIKRNDDANRIERENQTKRLETLNGQTDEIVSGLQRQIAENQARYITTLNNLQAISKEAATASKSAAESAQNSTGGDSFAYYTIEQFPDQQILDLHKKGRSPLYEVRALIENVAFFTSPGKPDLGPLFEERDVQIGDLPAGDQIGGLPALDIARDEPGSQNIAEIAPQHAPFHLGNDMTRLRVIFSARNGFWIEEIWNKDVDTKDGLRMTEAFRVYRAAGDRLRLILECVPPEFHLKWLRKGVDDFPEDFPVEMKPISEECPDTGMSITFMGAHSQK